MRVSWRRPASNIQIQDRSVNATYIRSKAALPVAGLFVAGAKARLLGFGIP
jgi:hypothetical protein